MRQSSFTALALFIALASSLCVAALFILTRYVVADHSNRVLLQSIDSDLSGLVNIYAASGEAELIQRLEDRLAVLPARRDREYVLLTNAAGEGVAGNLARWPLLSAENSETGRIVNADGVPILARATQLAPHLKLVVGRSLKRSLTLQRNLAAAFLIAGILVIGFAIIFGVGFAMRTRKRIEMINQTFRLVGNGALEARTRLGATQDEIYELGEHTNVMLDRVSGLITEHRHVTDHTAHEIRTPLMHLDTRILAILKGNDDPALAQDLGRARGHIKSIVAMLESLLDIAANEAHTGSLIGLEPLDFSALASDVADLYADSAEELQLTFKTQIADGVSLRGERMQLIRLLSNLLDNAFKYCGPNGFVAISLAPGPILQVRDSGPGIPEAERERIFNRFERTKRRAVPSPDQAQTRGAGSHGLGLSLARAIAERHGLTLLCLESTEGAVFSLQRP